MMRLARASLALLLLALCGFWHGAVNTQSLPTTFDPTDTGSYVTLTGGNLIGTVTTGGAPSYSSTSTRSLASYSTGKFYNEFKYNSVGTCTVNCVNETIFGIGNSSAAILGFDSNNSVGLFSDSATVYINSASAGTAQILGVGGTLGMAVDLGAQLIWLTNDGSTWNAGGGCTPANVGCGISFSAVAGPYYAYAEFNVFTGLQITADFGATPYAYTRPAGFSNWLGTGSGGGGHVFNPQAVRVQPFINGIGNNIHLTYGGTPYIPVSNVTTDYAYLGTTAARDFGLDSTNSEQASYNTMAAAGAKFDFAIASQQAGGCPPSPSATLTTLYGLIDTFVATYPGAMLSAEGPNEVNNFPVGYCNTNNATNGSTAAGNATLHYASTLSALQAVQLGGEAAQTSVSDFSQTIDPGMVHATATASSVAPVLTINHSGEQLLLCAQANDGPITSVVTSGLTWTKRASVGASGVDEEEWTAAGPTGGSYPQTATITVTQSGSATLTVDAAGVIGSNGTFDGSAVTSATDPVSITTSHANDMVIGCFRSTSQKFPSPGSSFAAVGGNGNYLWGTDYHILEWQLFTSTQSGFSVTLAANAAGTANGAIADALEMSSAVVLPLGTFLGTTLSSIGSTTITMASNAAGAGVATGDGTNFVAYYTNPAAALAWQQEIYNKTKADLNLSGVPVILFTDYPNAGVAGSADYNNQHFYPGGATQTAWIFGHNTVIPNLPEQVTEFGYYTMPDGVNGVSQLAQAILTMNGLLDIYNSGDPYIYIYELIDEVADPGNTNLYYHYGIFDNSNNPKTAATAIQSLVSVLKDTGGTALTFTPGTLNYSISPFPGRSVATDNAGANSILFQKSNGRFEIVEWTEPKVYDEGTQSDVTPPTISQTITLGITATTVNVYDPMVGSSPVHTYSSVNSVPLALTNQLIVEVIP